MSKFLKFKPILSRDETFEVLASMTGERPSEANLEELVRYRYLTPILGYGRLTIGFKMEELSRLRAGEKISPCVHSILGIVSDETVEIEDTLASSVITTDEHNLLFFAVPINDDGDEEVLDAYAIGELESLSSYLKNCHSYLTQEVYAVAEQANGSVHSATNALSGTARVSIKWREPIHWSCESHVIELYGFSAASGGKFSVSTQSASSNLRAQGEPKGKPLHPSERRSAGQIIATLAAMAELDLSAPYAADETLRAAAATHGLELPNSPETVVKFLKDAAARTGKV